MEDSHLAEDFAKKGKVCKKNDREVLTTRLASPMSGEHCRLARWSEGAASNLSQVGSTIDSCLCEEKKAKLSPPGWGHEVCCFENHRPMD
jgi:hypothetical protein